MRRDDAARMLDMLLAARDAAAFADGRTRDDLDEDRQLLLALVKAVEIVGEAAAHVGEDTKSAHPEIPWARIVGMRNRLVHGYSDVRLETVWNTVRDDLPALIARLEPLVPPEPE